VLSGSEAHQYLFYHDFNYGNCDSSMNFDQNHWHLLVKPSILIEFAESFSAAIFSRSCTSMTYVFCDDLTRRTGL